MGEVTSRLDPWLDTSQFCQWMFFVSRGGLRVPSEAFLSVVRQMELEFNIFHGTTDLRREDMIIEKFTNILQQKFRSQLDDQILKKFSETRTYIRFKFLVQRLREKCDTMRKWKQTGQFTN